MTWCNDEKTLCRSSWASSAIRANFVEMSPEHRVPVTFPSRGSLKPDTPSLCRVLVGRVPRLLRYNECLRLLDGHSASLRFLRSAVPVVLALFVVPDGLHPRQRAAGGGRGFRSRIAHLRIRQEPSRSLQFLHLPRGHAPLYDPGRACASVTLGRAGAAFRVPNRVGPYLHHLSWLNHAACTLAVYASWVRSPARCTQDSLPADGQLCRAGSTPRGDQEGFSHCLSDHGIPLQQAFWTH